MNDILPQRPRAHVLGELAVAAVKNCLPPEWIIREEKSDYGIDLVCEIVKGTSVTGTLFAIQVKGKDSSSKGNLVAVKNIKKSTINYWHNRPERVMLAVYLREENNVVWQWTDHIQVPYLNSITINTSKNYLLSLTDWKQFIIELNSYYEKLLPASLEHAHNIISRSSKSQQTFEFSTINVLNAKCTIKINPDSSILNYGENRISVFDCGKKSGDEIVSWLNHKAIKKIDILVISHFHLDRFCGVELLLDAVEEIEMIMMPPLSVLNNNDGCNNTLSASLIIRVLSKIEKFKKSGCNVITFNSERINILLGKTKNKSKLSLDVFFPTTNLIEILSKHILNKKSKLLENKFNQYTDHNSICPVIKINCDKTSFLITGDASTNVWHELIEKNGENIKADGLILPRHGSKHNLSKNIIKSIIKSNKFIAIVSSRIKYGLPSKEIVSLITSIGGNLINVDQNPAILQMDKKGIKVI